jgi:hypothetical protein
MLSGMAAFAQTASPPPSADTNVVEAFLRFQNFLVQTIQRESAVNATSSDTMKASAAALFKVTTADFDKINPVYVVLKTKLDALDSEGVAYANSTAGKGHQADVKVLAGFEARRQALVRGAITDLQSRLTADGWNGICAYINGDFSKNITRTPVK